MKGRFVLTESSWVINFQQKMSNSKKGKFKESERRWMKEEIEIQRDFSRPNKQLCSISGEVSSQTAVE